MKNGISKKLPKVCYQHIKKAITNAKNSKVIDSTYGGIASVATPLIIVVSDCMIPDKTGVEFSGKSKNPMFLTKMDS
jgi:hypothetical protein